MFVFISCQSKSCWFSIKQYKCAHTLPYKCIHCFKSIWIHTTASQTSAKTNKHIQWESLHYSIAGGQKHICITYSANKQCLFSLMFLSFSQNDSNQFNNIKTRVETVNVTVCVCMCVIFFQPSSYKLLIWLFVWLLNASPNVTYIKNTFWMSLRKPNFQLFALLLLHWAKQQDTCHSQHWTAHMCMLYSKYIYFF